MKRYIILPALCSAMALPGVRAQAQTIRFSGMDWQVKTGDNLGPGPNKWRAANVRVDAKGRLHLKISRENGQWTCGEVSTTTRMGFGRYQFQVSGRIDQLDKNIVLGLFNYPTPDVGGDGTNEIDIEMAHWGNITYPIGNYTIWPARAGVKQSTNPFVFTLKDDKTTQRWTWHTDSILFQSLHGFRNDDRSEIARWLFKPANALDAIPQKPMPLLINLWLFEGHAPSDGKEVEIVIEKVTFVPQTS